MATTTTDQFVRELVEDALENAESAITTGALRGLPQVRAKLQLAIGNLRAAQRALDGGRR